jgi:RNA polymerase sigma factor (sigma-70 family)
VSGRHAADVELAQRCAEGDEQAWQRFMLEYRPLLYRAADALDASGRARDIADSLYAELYGIRGDRDQRQSLFLYFEGRSSLAVWLRAVLVQRYVDRLRADGRFEPLPANESGDPNPGARVDASRAIPDPDRSRYQSLVADAFGRVVAALHHRDKLRLACYYVQGLTLAETGRLLGEHEATASRHLARTRKAIRAQVERVLRDTAGLTDAQIAECFAAAVDDPGSLDLQRILTAAADSDARAEEGLNAPAVES